MVLQQGTLWERIRRTTEDALASGALLPTPTDYTFIEDHGVRFFVRVLSGLRRKDEARKEQESAAKTGRQANPFLPPEKDLTVADLSDTHIAVLNKFNVVPHHLLIVTKHFEEQDMLLTLKDFEALWLCMAEFEGLGFYNGGTEAGASQRHKHLQLVPLPLAPEGPGIPIAPLLTGAEGKNIGTLPSFSFVHAFARFDKSLAAVPSDAAGTTFLLYRNLLTKVGMMPPDTDSPTRQSLPYCFLMTREWMLVVPRKAEFFEDISLNSLAYAGSLFVRNEKQLDRLRSVGPLQALAYVAIEKGTSSRECNFT